MEILLESLLFRTRICWQLDVALYADTVIVKDNILNRLKTSNFGAKIPRRHTDSHVGTVQYWKKGLIYAHDTLIHQAFHLLQKRASYYLCSAKTEAEACVLIEAGFEFVCDFNGHKIFKKKKY